MTRFEDRLELELEAVVAENPAPAPARRRFGWKPRMALVGAVATAAAAVAVSGIVQPASPAWAVEKTDEGVVTVTFKEFEDPEGLENALAKVGLRAAIVFVPHGKMRDCEGSAPDETDPATPVTVRPDGERSTLELHYRPQRSDQTVAIQLWIGPATDHERGHFVSIRYQNVLGPVARCELVPADTMFPVDRKHQSGTVPR
jgi:hypothetical protein